MIIKNVFHLRVSAFKSHFRVRRTVKQQENKRQGSKRSSDIL